MPTYTYACADCETTFDTVQSIHDDALTQCPTCGGPIRRVISAVGVSFKGSGFYRTDSRASGSSTRSGGGTSGGATTSSTESSKPSSGSTNGAASPA